MKGARLLWLYLAAALVFTGGAGAEDFDADPWGSRDLADLYGDAQFVSIATGSRKPIYKAPAVATVITAEEIKAMGARDLNEVLETVPGLHVSLSPLSRLDSVYSIRGIHTGFNPHVLLLRNGVPFPYVFSGGRPNLFRLPVASIARIEVIRGPGSAVYGADAFAGVINVITKESDDIRGTEAGGRVGSFDTHDLWLLHGGSWGPWDIAFSLEWQESAGDRSRRIDADFQSFLDGTMGTTASRAPGPLSTRYEVLDSHLEIRRGDLRLRNWYWRLSDAGQGTGGAQALDPEGRENVEQYLVDLAYATTLRPSWDLNAVASYLYRDTRSRFVLLPPGTRAPIGPDGNIDFDSPAEVLFPDGLLGNPGAREHQTGMDLVFLYTGHRNNRLRLGAGIRYFTFRPSESKNFGPGVIDGSVSPIDGALTDLSGTPFIFSPDRSRTLYYLLVQDEWQILPDWELTAGIRYDHYSDFGETINPRLALVWATRYNLTTKLLYGRAFRAPSFSELFAVNNPVVLGNPDLKPETIDTLELAFDYRPTFNLQTVVSFFVYEADNLIEFVGGATRTAQNARDQQGYGFEVEADWKVRADLRLLGNYSFQRSRDKATKERIPEAPGQQAYLRAEWQFHPGFFLTPQVLWVGDRRRSPVDPRAQIDDYTMVHLTLRATNLAANWEFALSGRNIFNVDAREPSSGPEAPVLPISIPGDYPLEGRSLLGEVRYSF